eukprot:scaffold2177_cov272-Pinguiococcus_pyrenoidosus.AAC.9
MVLPRLQAAGIDCIAFPDDGAAKRFKTSFPDFALITCGKTRDGDDRRVVIQEGSAEGRHVCIVDDLVQTGGTLHEAGKALVEDGALSVSCFVAHGVFPNEAWRRFAKGGDRGGLFRKFWVTNSCISVTRELPTDDCFEVRSDSASLSLSFSASQCLPISISLLGADAGLPSRWGNRTIAGA